MSSSQFLFPELRMECFSVQCTHIFVQMKKECLSAQIHIFLCLAHPSENVRQKQRTERLDYHLASPVRANSNQGTDSLPRRSHKAACDVLVVDVDRDHLCRNGL